ncbi:hypothetical protein FB451DRAFT_1359183 [Mycena latifolia]|nr:hypothetical protein FB451DRAFT_1359183 [Mycena latifolia]
MTYQFEYPSSNVTPPTLTSMHITPNHASNYLQSQQYAVAESYATRLFTNSSTPSWSSPANSYEYAAQNGRDVQRTAYLPAQRDVPLDSPALQHAGPDPYSLTNFSAAPSTPSDKYDEDAENIDPKSLEMKEMYQCPVPARSYSQATNVLRDSQAYPVSFKVALPLPQPNRLPEGAEQIAAPVPLPYSARSKEVLSAMISPVQPSGFPKPVLPVAVEEETEGNEELALAYPSSTPSVLSSDTAPNFSSNAAQGLHYDYSDQMARYTILHPTPRKYIRPISPATLIALTEPCLMAWIRYYRFPPAPMRARAVAPATGYTLKD